MKKSIHLQVSFNTPAFLGNAEQKGEWRTPPFKALLREWWRIAMAPEVNYDHERLREEEGQLFGHAWLQEEQGQRSGNNPKTWAMRSQLRITCGNWQAGKSIQLQKQEKIFHPEAEKAKNRVDPCLYLGFGPILLKTVRSALVPGAETKLGLQYEKKHEEQLLQTIKLASWFGTMGSRSRNGWGSLQVIPQAEEVPKWFELPHAPEDLSPWLRPLDKCLGLTWPHGLGADDRGNALIWKTQECSCWEAVMRILAETKIYFRTNLKFTKGHGAFEERHLLSYPVTEDHKVSSWHNGRLANQLRFKVVRKDNGKLIGLVFHLPCALPHELAKALPPQERKFAEEMAPVVWRKVHGSLDKRLTRLFK